MNDIILYYVVNGVTITLFVLLIQMTLKLQFTLIKPHLNRIIMEYKNRSQMKNTVDSKKF